MLIRMMLASVVLTVACQLAIADQKYSFHENLHVGQVVPAKMDYDGRSQMTSTTDGTQTVTDDKTSHHWKVTLTILEQKDGSAVRAKAEVDASSYDTAKKPGEDEKKSACPFVGKNITLSRLPDESFTNDYPEKDASGDDVNLLNNFLCPDEDFFPDTPVAVGDVWDNSAKLSKHSMLGPKDQLASSCRLDWVKTIDGKQMAQISNSLAIIYREDRNVEEDLQATATMVVDMSKDMIVKADQTGTSKLSTPASEATQVTGGTDFTYHEEVLGAGATTKP